MCRFPARTGARGVHGYADAEPLQPYEALATEQRKAIIAGGMAPFALGLPVHVPVSMAVRRGGGHLARGRRNQRIEHIRSTARRGSHRG